MPWTSKFAALFTKPLVRQIVAILNRDIQSALDYVSGVPGSLPKFSEWDLALLPVEQFPAILVAPQTDEFDPESLGSLQQKIRVFVSLAVTHQNRNTLAEQVQDYVRAVDEVLNSAWWLTPTDFYASLALPSPPFATGSTTAGLPSGSLVRLFIEGHAYDEIRRVSQGPFALAATISLLCELEET